MAKLNVIIYTMHDCPFCQRAKDILEELGIPYEERNVSESLKHRQDLQKRTKEDKLPTIIINDQVLIKPGEDKLRATINFERHR